MASDETFDFLGSIGIFDCFIRVTRTNMTSNKIFGF